MHFFELKFTLEIYISKMPIYKMLIKAKLRKFLNTGEIIIQKKSVIKGLPERLNQ